MKKTSVLLIFFLFHQYIFAQKDQYYDFIKTWNFIKYYHPDLATGKIDADSLFLMNVKNISSQDDFNSIVEKLTGKLNKKFIASAPAETSQDVFTKNQNFNWFQKNRKISSENKEVLNSIYNHRYNFENLPKGKLVSDEKKYAFPKTENLSVEYRLLALAKIQGVVDYLFPHKYIMDKGFEEYFKNSLNENSKVTSRKDFEIILAKLVSKMKDSHAFKFYRELNYRNDFLFNASYYSPFDYKIVDNYLLVTDIIFPEICTKANIKKGDHITEINGKKVSQIIDEKSRLLSVSNREKLIFELSSYQNNLIWPDNSPQKSLKVKSGNKTFTTNIELVNTLDKTQVNVLSNYINNKNQKWATRELINKDIAYFNINNTLQFINDVDDEKIDKKMENIILDASKKKAMVFDMRGYPDWGGFIFHYVYKYFSPSENYFYKYYAPNLKNIGTFVYLKDSYHYFPEINDMKTMSYPGKVFIIVNPESRSASEWYTMSLQKIFPQSITIGQQTAGADGDIVKVNLPGSYLLEFTGNGIFYPDNSQTQQTGVRIDEMIKYKDQDFLNKKDLEFERVLNALK
ncbi:MULTISPECIES: S41 family peptidase [Chryseobacterium]|uniref:S41 family peptidase n=1 Tax=Chryseobacterium TaxID=59732 RepID=UPI001959DC24|nr:MULTISPECIES: S41 family peptidase [Chryseobacterium]MBM7419295.1 C-terminal processing protease CtpA/Prc [Chryseobacterium sp. JUb44]MDH6209218.1 C-terminal processing protease CtpA/Prc [Chryseobacterium sp. BIGb0186]WSO12063.1 S41 family peptidase [Chryseobacterium scophthalmum]